MYVRFDRPYGTFDDQFHAHRRREVKDDVALVDEFGNDRLVVDAIDRVVEPGVLPVVANIVDAPRRQVVEHIDLVTSIEVDVRKMRSDESRTTGNENSHGS